MPIRNRTRRRLANFLGARAVSREWVHFGKLSKTFLECASVDHWNWDGIAFDCVKRTHFPWWCTPFSTFQMQTAHASSKHATGTTIRNVELTRYELLDIKEFERKKRCLSSNHPSIHLSLGPFSYILNVHPFARHSLPRHPNLLQFTVPLLLLCLFHRQTARLSVVFTESTVEIVCTAISLSQHFIFAFTVLILAPDEIGTFVFIWTTDIGYWFKRSAFGERIVLFVAKLHTNRNGFVWFVTRFSMELHRLHSKKTKEFRLRCIASTHSLSSEFW